MSQSIDNDIPSQNTISRTSSISSSSTVTDILGTSRTVGHVFTVLGTSLEQALSSWSSNNKPAEHSYQTGVDYDCSSSSSDDTQSHIPGPSRSLDELTGIFGAALERRMNLYANKLGFGPSASMRRLISTSYTRDAKDTEKERQRRLKECKKLLKYAYSNSLQTQLAAVQHIITIAVSDVRLRQSLIDSGAYQALHTLHPFLLSRIRGFKHDSQYDVLLTSSRQALYCIEENAVNNLAKDLFFSPPRTLLMSQFLAEVDTFAIAAIDNALIYLAVRYMTSERGWRNMLLLGRTRKRVMERVFEELLGFPVIVGDDGIITDEKTGNRISY